MLPINFIETVELRDHLVRLGRPIMAATGPGVCLDHFK